MIKEIVTPLVFFMILLLVINSKRYFKSASISKNVLLIGFSLKAFSAILFGYLFKTRMLSGGDTYVYFDDANIVHSAMLQNPFIYLKLLIGFNDFTPVPSIMQPYTETMHFWFDSSNYFVVRVNAFIRLFSFGVYNVHAIIFSFLSFFGTYNLYLFFENKVYSKKMLQFILFGIPSIVFWTSGVHKEALVIFSLGIILYNLDFILKGNYTRRNLFLTIIGLVLLGYIRIYLLAFMMPLISGILFYSKFEFKKPSSVSIYLITIIACFLLLVFMDTVYPKFNFVQEFLVRRTYFLNSPGNMTFSVEHVPHNISGSLLLIWEAIINPFVRPFPSDCSNILPILASVETYLILFIIVILLFSANFKSIISNPYAMFCILFGFSTLFLIGLIVNNSGAIVRYRSIAIPFLLIGLCLTRKEPITTKIATVAVQN
ncbi:MAG: hypothetical protein IPL21_19395 [Saprospirales bacterium]|nr:hypothetical protein [Saprospirales bacterium]